MAWLKLFRPERDLSSLRLAEVHSFKRLDQRMLFSVGSLLFYSVSPPVFDLVKALRERTPEALEALEKHPTRDVRRAIRELRKLGLIQRNGVRPEPARLSKPRGVRHLELLVTHGCNMRCSYCYGSTGDKGWEASRHLYGSRSSGMSWEVARRGIDFLFDRSGNSNEISLIFFGGEPLLEFDLMRKSVAYGRRREAESGKRLALSLSTNGSLLTQPVVDYLVENRVGCQISIDGPPEIHDRNRRLAGGKPSYERVLPGVKRLIKARPGRVPARVTVAHGAVEIPKIVEHLLSLGFGSVHVEPVVGPSPQAVTEEDLQRIEEQNESLARCLVQNTLSDRIFDYANLVRYVRQTRVVRQRLAFYCGAARTYLALAQDGAFYPCHRFVGLKAFRMGDIWNGFDTEWQQRILSMSVDERPGCSGCWARYLCGGGCWQNSLVTQGRLEKPDSNVSCRLIRHQLECAMAVNAALGVGDEGVFAASPA